MLIEGLELCSFAGDTSFSSVFLFDGVWTLQTYCYHRLQRPLNYKRYQKGGPTLVVKRHKSKILLENPGKQKNKKTKDHEIKKQKMAKQKALKFKTKQNQQK